MTRYIKEEEVNGAVVAEIASAMKQRKIVVFKTDTVYGIGTNSFNADTCKRIYDIKGRPIHKPLSL